jgi:hypothetical protein
MFGLERNCFINCTLYEHVAQLDDIRNAYTVFEGNRPLGRRGRTWKDNIRMDPKEVECKAWTRFNWLRMSNGAYM